MREGNIFSLSTLVGYPILLMGQEIPNPRSGLGVLLSQVQMGYPILLMGGTPIQDQDRGYPGVSPGWGLDRVPHQDWMGVPLSRTGWGNPSQISIASTCYAAGGMPLAFKQEDFLVVIDFEFCSEFYKGKAEEVYSLHDIQRSKVFCSKTTEYGRRRISGTK